MFTKTHNMTAQFKTGKQAQEFAARYLASWEREFGSATVSDIVIQGRTVTWTAVVTHRVEEETYTYPNDLRENAGAIGGTSAKVNGIRARREW